MIMIHFLEIMEEELIDPNNEIFPVVTISRPKNFICNLSIVVEKLDDKVIVKVGDVAHPMQDDHYIEWIALETPSGNQRKPLKPGDEPKVCFRICDGDEVKKAYAYCNLHSLWSS